MKKIFIFGMLGLSLSSCTFLDILTPGTEVSRVESGTIPTTGGITALNLDFPLNLTLSPIAGTNIVYTITKKVQAASVVRGNKALDEMTFQKSQAGSEQDISMSVPKIDYWYVYGVSIEGTIQIPSNIKILKCSASSGNLIIDGGANSFAKMDLKATSGQIDVKNFSLASNSVFSGVVTSGNLKINTMNVANGSSFTFSDESGSADITIASIIHSSVTGTITSGSLVFNNSSLSASTFNIEVTSGSLDMNTDVIGGLGSMISLKDTSGSVDFSTSVNNSASFDLQTTSGGIHVDSKYGAPNHDDNVTFSRNSGGNAVVIRCTSGSINLD